MNMQLLQFIILLGTQIATTNNPDARALAYMQLLNTLMQAGSLTNDGLSQLVTQYEQDVTNDAPVSPEYLKALGETVAGQSAAIQSA